MEASSAEPRGQCVTPGSVADLTVWLQGHGIDTSTWGEGQAKTVDSLLKEIEQEETSLMSVGQQAFRCLTVVQVVVRQPERMDHHLACYQQTMKDGRVRQRNLLPSEKVYAGEDLTKAVRRCIHEELGSQLDPADPTGTAPSPRTSLGLALVKAPKTSIALVEGCFVEWEEVVESPSYPGLTTRYMLKQMTAIVHGLPFDEFVTTEGPTKRHSWEWRKDGAADCLVRKTVARPVEPLGIKFENEPAQGSYDTTMATFEMEEAAKEAAMAIPSPREPHTPHAPHSWDTAPTVITEDTGTTPPKLRAVRPTGDGGDADARSSARGSTDLVGSDSEAEGSSSPRNVRMRHPQLKQVMEVDLADLSAEETAREYLGGTDAAGAGGATDAGGGTTTGVELPSEGLSAEASPDASPDVSPDASPAFRRPVGPDGEVHDVQLSKLLAKLLRHEADRVRVPMDPDGWVLMADALTYINDGPAVDDGGVWLSVARPVGERTVYTADDIREVVTLNDKKRYEVRDTDGADGTVTTHVRACQGHTIKRIRALGKLLSLDAHADGGFTADGVPTVVAVPFAVHGTFEAALEGEEGILRRGLHKMARNQIHLTKGLHGEEAVISGMRRDCSVYIWVDVYRAMSEGGLRFWETPNGVILCEGDAEGCLPPTFFSVIIVLKDGLVVFEQKTALVRIIERLYSGSSLVTVSKLHGGFSGSLVLNVDSKTAGRPNEPTVLKIDSAEATVAETARTNLISELVGAEAIRALRGPIYVGVHGEDKTGLTDAELEQFGLSECLGGVVLEMAGACWVMPEFYGKIGKVQLLTTFKQQIVGQLVQDEAYASCNPPLLLRNLYGHGGPLSNLSLKTVTRAAKAADPKKGFLAASLKTIVESTAIAFCPSAGGAAELARARGYVPPPGLRAALEPLPAKVRKADKFECSFVLGAPRDTWDDEACEPLVELIESLRGLLESPSSSWLGSWVPLSTHQHGDLNSANILVDVHDGLWLIDFAKSGHYVPFHDAAKMISTILFEYFPIPFGFGEVRVASAAMLRDGLSLMDEQAELLRKLAATSESREQLNDAVRASGDESLLRKVLEQINDDEICRQRMEEACAIVDVFLEPVSKNGREACPELWQIFGRPTPAGWPSHADQTLQLIVQIAELATTLTSKCSQRAQAAAGQGGGGQPLAADLHVANLLLPLLLRALSTLRYADLPVWKKRVAWHFALRCSERLVEALPRKPVPPPRKNEASSGLRLRLCLDQPLMVLIDTAARAAGGEGDGRLHVVSHVPEVGDGKKAAGASLAQELIPASGSGAFDFEPFSLPVRFDDLSQAVLPWRAPREGLVEALLNGARRDVQALRELQRVASEFSSGEMTLQQVASVQRALGGTVPTSVAMSKYLAQVAILVTAAQLSFVQKAAVTVEAASMQATLFLDAGVKPLKVGGSLEQKMAVLQRQIDAMLADLNEEIEQLRNDDTTALAETHQTLTRQRVDARERLRVIDMANARTCFGAFKRFAADARPAAAAAATAETDGAASVDPTAGVDGEAVAEADALQSDERDAVVRALAEADARVDEIRTLDGQIFRCETRQERTATRVRQIERSIAGHHELKELEAARVAMSTACKKAAEELRARLANGLASTEWDALGHFFSEELRRSGALGMRRYAAGQHLFVRKDDGEWIDAEVAASPQSISSCAHVLRRLESAKPANEAADVGAPTPPLTLRLTPFNHTPSELALTSFNELWMRHCKAMRVQHASITDALSGRRLDTLAHCVSIELMQASSTSTPSGTPADNKGRLKVEDVAALAQWLEAAHAKRFEGDVPTPTCVLLTAGPAAGKTCLMSQLVMHIVPTESTAPPQAAKERRVQLNVPPSATVASTGAFIPIMVRVQDLQRRLLADEEAFAHSWNWVDAYLASVHGSNSEMYRFLRQAMMARRALLLLDGLDEGGRAREQIERHVTEVLAVQGHVMLITSRPNGVNEALFTMPGFHTLQLRPLTDAQQAAVVDRRLASNAKGEDDDGGQTAALLMDYIRTKVPRDAETGDRVTGNPLMLSMVMSIFESQKASAEADAIEAAVDSAPTGNSTKIDMPETIIELYRVASNAMLNRLQRKERGDASADIPDLRELLEALFFHSHGAERRIIRESDLETATLGLAMPDALFEIQSCTRVGDERSAAVHKAMGRLPKAKVDAIASICERVRADRLPLLSLLQAVPIEMQSSHLSFQEFYAANGISKGYILPPESAAPWRWSPWWANTLRLGNEIGEAFETGLLRAAQIDPNASQLDLRALVGGHRPTSFQALLMICAAMPFVDLRDNLITDDEVATLADALLRSKRITRICLAGNCIEAAGTKHLVKALAAPDAPNLITELDLSRNRVWRDGASAVSDCLGDLARLLSSSASLSTLRLGGSQLSDELGSQFLLAFTLPKGKPCVSALSTLDLSGNLIGTNACGALCAVLGACPSLATLDLSRNCVGAEGGLAIAKVLPLSASLRVLNLASNNLCDCSPNPKAWRADAIAALMQVWRGGVAIAELSLHSNALGGVWADRICGERVVRGSYNPAALDAILDCFNSDRVALTTLDIGGNELRDGDMSKVAGALDANSRKSSPRPVAQTSAGATNAPGMEAQARRSLAKRPAVIETHATKESKELDTTTMASGESTQATYDQTTATADVDEDGGSMDELASLPSSPDFSLHSSPESSFKSASSSFKSAAAVVAPALQLGKISGGSPGDRSKRSPRANWPAGGSTSSQKERTPTSDASSAQRSARGKPGSNRPKTATPSPTQPQQSDRAATSGTRRSPGAFAASSSALGWGQTERASPQGGSKSKAGSKGGTTPRSSSKAANPSGSAKPAAHEATVAKDASVARNSVGTGKGGARKGAVPEPPKESKKMLVCTTQAVIAREDKSRDSKSVGTLKAGWLLRVLFSELEPVPRMHVMIEGDSEPVGWITYISKDGTEFVKQSTLDFPLMKATKPLVVREGKAKNSKKADVGDISVGTLLRVMDEAALPDGTVRMLVGANKTLIDEIGWVTATKDDGGHNLEPAPTLTTTFDLNNYTAEALSRALEKKLTGKESRQKKKADKFKLPVQLAGKRPLNRADEAPSRHRLVQEPASIMLMFNCHNAAFEVTSCPFDMETLPGSTSFEMVSVKSRARLGLVRIAKDLGMAFLERVDFPDEWLVAGPHGLEHDGWQGTGFLELELNWDGKTASILAHPWLSYGCSVGARMLIRKRNVAEGQIATVQRVLDDDRCVVRLDGFTVSDGVQGETVVDPQPSTIVRTTSPGYPSGTELLVMHNNRLVNATVLQWLGSADFSEGSRHMIHMGAAAEGKHGSQAWCALNQYNHVVRQLSASVYEETRTSYCQYIVTTEDKVEDAITGNELQIRDQLIFMALHEIADGVQPGDYATVRDVPALVSLLVQPSPKRSQGAHHAQPVLCRAGPGTGKTWMVKQSMFLLATSLQGNGAGAGIRLMPIVVFVQRIVRLLRELGDDPSKLLADPNGLCRWYIKNQFADRPEERTLLLHAYDMRALVILVDGVDEAAGLRDIVEAFVHYELVPSGNRLVVTSRPEGVDLEDYKARFVVMNLLPLSQEQQRNVIQMQLQGNSFFEHLVNIGECRKLMDEQYRRTFHTQDLRKQIEEFDLRSGAAGAGDDGDDGAAVPTRQAQGAEAEAARPPTKGKGSVVQLDVPSSASVAAPPGAMKRRGTHRALHVAPLQEEVTAWVERAKDRKLLSHHLQMIDQTISPKGDFTLLEQFESDIRLLPVPCTRAQMQRAILGIQDSLGGDPPLSVLEALEELGLLRKYFHLSAQTGAKGTKLHVPIYATWLHIVEFIDPLLATSAQCAPALSAALRSLSEAQLDIDEPSFCNPVLLWRSATESGRVSSWKAPWTVRVEEGARALAAAPTAQSDEAGPEVLRKLWTISVRIQFDAGDQLLAVLKKLADGVTLNVDGEPTTLTTLALDNAFHPRRLHPTHLRDCSCFAVLTHKGDSVLARVQLTHTELQEQFNVYEQHYCFFWEQVPQGLTQFDFNVKFETLLIFLIEAIGVPVLLSLLLLAYTSVDEDMLDLDALPADRLQLYKLGITAAVKRRLLVMGGPVATAATDKGAAKAVENKKADDEAAPSASAAEGGRSQKVKRKAGSDLGRQMSTMNVTAAVSTNEQASKAQQRQSNEPILDLNSILRGSKVKVVSGEEGVAEAYSLVVRVLDKTRSVKGMDLRTAITSIAPKNHPLHLPVTALAEYVSAPIAATEAAMLDTATKMVRRVAVTNQENGRREFTSRHVACALGATPEELGLWTRLDLDHQFGVALTATLAKQTDRAPAQYQFKHLSFQEGLYAEYLLITVKSLQAPKPGWPGWMNDQLAADFLNNRYMANTCRIAAGHLGSLLAQQRPHWDFRQVTLDAVGRQALWAIGIENTNVESILVAQNDVTVDDVSGLSKVISSCTSLQSLDLSDNDLHRLTVQMSEWHTVCTALAGNNTLTDLDLSSNRLQGAGTRLVCRALMTSTALKRLGFSFNEPGAEPALAELLGSHPSLTAFECVEAYERHLPSKVKDEIGRALLANKAGQLGFLTCDMFTLNEKAESLEWPKDASTSDAMLLAGMLKTNTVLTSFNLSAGASLVNNARSALGDALLQNPNSRVSYCNDFGLTPGVDTCEFDLAKPELKDVEPFRLLAGCLRGNRTLTQVTLKQLRFEQIETLALALRGNSTLAKLTLIHTTRMGGVSSVQLPVPMLNGADGTNKHLVDLSTTVMEGNLGRVACETIGMLIAANTSLKRLCLRGTGLGIAIGQEAEGGHIVLRPLCQSKACPVSELDLSNIQLNDKAGVKLMGSWASGLAKKTAGYDKIRHLSLASNDLGRSTGSALKEVLWAEGCTLQHLDLSSNMSLEGSDIAQAIKRNYSLTSLDIRQIPTANTDALFDFFAEFLLQDDCRCPLGFLSCDEFQVEVGTASLTLGGKATSSGKAVSQKACLKLLAGVLKFNTSLRSLCLAETGFDGAAAGFFSAALRANKDLEHLDLSRNPLVDAEQYDIAAISKIAKAVETHPALLTINVDGRPLPVTELRGGDGAAEMLEFIDWQLGPTAGVLMGTLVSSNRLLTNLNLRSNKLGTVGAEAMTNGLQHSPLKALNLSTSGLGDGLSLKGFSTSVSRRLGWLMELRMDDNGLTAGADELAPLCMLRNIRTLSLEKNQLSAVPSLIGTTLSLRHLSLRSNHLTELPASICLLINLDSLDLNKNHLRALPGAIGQLSSLLRLELSENKLVELPSSFCELSDDIQVSVVRNPLERPSIEQARQGISAIRRFFGFQAKRGAADNEAVAEGAMEQTLENDPANCPYGVADRDSGRHNWAGPASMTLLFNCHRCAFAVVDGDVSVLEAQRSYELVAAFNLQTVGHVRESKGGSGSEPLADRVGFSDLWLPWRLLKADPANSTLLVKLRTTSAVARAAGKQDLATLVCRPWLAFGCSIGARMKTAKGYATVCGINANDSVQVAYDNTGDKREVAEIDPRPDTVSRAARYEYKQGHKLFFRKAGEWVDALVEEYYGAKQGCRHRLRISDAHGADGKVTQVLDLNESNHSRLLFQSVAKYEEARSQHCKELLSKHTIVRDEATGKDLAVEDQRLFVVATDEPPTPADSTTTAPEDVSAVKMVSTTKVSILTMLEGLIVPHESTPTPQLIRVGSKWEHELLINHALRALADKLCVTDTTRSDLVPLVPVCISVLRLVQIVQEQTAKQQNRSPLMALFERDFPAQSDMLKQAMEMRGLVIVADVRDEFDPVELKESVVEELLGNRLIIACDQPTRVPAALRQRCAHYDLSALGLFFNDAKLAEKDTKEIFKRMRSRGSEVMDNGALLNPAEPYYCRVQALHVGNSGDAASDIGRDALQSLSDLLTSDLCVLRSLDVSYTKVDGWDLVQALRSNASLTSLDVRGVPRMADLYETLGGILLMPGCPCKVGYLRCSAFELHEGDQVLSLRERSLEPGAPLLLAGLLKHNSTLYDLDVSACEIDRAGAAAFAAVLEYNATLKALRVAYNPLIDEDGKSALRTAAAKWRPSLVLTLS